MDRMIGTLLAAAVLLAAATAQDAKTRPVDPFKNGAGVPAGAVAVLDVHAISEKEFVEAVYERFRSHVRGIEALDNLVQTHIVEYEMRKRGMVIGEVELEAEFRRLDEQLRDATGGKSTLAAKLEESGRTRREFLSTLRVSVALQKMAGSDLAKDEVSLAEQKQWLRSKTIAANVERDVAKLPEDAAARVFSDFITRKEFAVTVIKALPQDEIVLLVKSLLQADLARRMCAEAEIEITPDELERGYERIKHYFESNPNHEGIPFEDYISQRTGMDIASYKASPGFHREVCLHALGTKLVPDDAVPGAYREQIEWYGPVYDVKHILIRGTDDPKGKEVSRTRAQARGEIENVLARIEKGERFEAAVKLYSEDRRSKFKGGTLGSYTPKEAAGFPGLAAVIGEMEIGDVRGPIESKAGWHLVKLAGKRPAPPLSEEIASEVRKRVASREFGRAWRQAKYGIDLRRFLGE